MKKTRASRIFVQVAVESVCARFAAELKELGYLPIVSVSDDSDYRQSIMLACDAALITDEGTAAILDAAEVME